MERNGAGFSSSFLNKTEGGSTMAKLMNIKDFAAETRITPEIARQRCNSKIYRENKIARREGKEWRIDWDRYRKIVWGDDK
jgi:hypothetical protein